MKLQKITLGIFLVVFISCGQQKSNTHSSSQAEDTIISLETKQLASDTVSDFDSKQAIAMLKEFYTNYLYAIDARNYVEADSIISKYSTKQMLKQLEQAVIDEYDYDLFLNGQYFELEWLKAMSIYADSVGVNDYIVAFKHYSDYYEREIRHKIKLHLVKINNHYKIDKALHIETE
jgi:hypothetical protein